MIYAGLDELQIELLLRMREKSQIVWETKDKQLIPINQMTDSHLINAIKMLEKQEEEDAMEVIYSDLRGLDLNDIC